MASNHDSPAALFSSSYSPPILLSILVFNITYNNWVVYVHHLVRPFIHSHFGTNTVANALGVLHVIPAYFHRQSHHSMLLLVLAVAAITATTVTYVNPIREHDLCKCVSRANDGRVFFPYTICVCLCCCCCFFFSSALFLFHLSHIRYIPFSSIDVLSVIQQSHYVPAS